MKRIASFNNYKALYIYIDKTGIGKSSAGETTVRKAPFLLYWSYNLLDKAFVVDISSLLAAALQRSQPGRKKEIVHSHNGEIYSLSQIINQSSLTRGTRPIYNNDMRLCSFYLFQYKIHTLFS